MNRVSNEKLLHRLAGNQLLAFWIGKDRPGQGPSAERFLSPRGNERMDTGASARHARADWFPAWLSIGSGDQRGAQDPAIGNDPRLEKRLGVFSQGRARCFLA